MYVYRVWRERHGSRNEKCQVLSTNLKIPSKIFDEFSAMVKYVNETLYGIESTVG